MTLTMINAFVIIMRIKLVFYVYGKFMLWCEKTTLNTAQHLADQQRSGQRVFQLCKLPDQGKLRDEIIEYL